jgi:pyruvate ferredoxin oxidoreductase alpha subunit
MTVAIKTQEGAQILTGGEAVAYAFAQIDPDVFPVYPITPQTPIIQTLAKLVANGRASAEVVNVESEHSAMSAAIGSALAGARSMTATSSQGLALMAEMVYIAAGMRAPLVMAVGNRALSAPINIHSDHSDSMMIRDSGVIQLFAESVQEVYDLAVLAPRIAEHPDVMLPVLVCQDGFTLTHSEEPLVLIPDDDVKAFVGDYHVPLPLLDVDQVTTKGPFALQDYYTELRYQMNAAMEAAPAVIDQVFAEYSELSGRPFTRLEPYRLEGAKKAIFLMGSTAGTIKDVVDELRDQGEAVGLLRLISYRPFPAEEIREALSGVEEVIVLDRSDAPGGFTSLHAEIATALYGSSAKLRAHVFGLGGRELVPEEARAIFADEAPTHVGLRS